MITLVKQQGNTEDTALTRTDLMRLLEEGGRPEQLDVSSQDLRGIDLMNCNLEGANLSQALTFSHIIALKWW